MGRTQLGTPPRRKVALLGFAESYKQAPFDDPTVEIWALNEMWKYTPRWDRWFEVHPRDVFAVEGQRDQEAHLAWLQQQDASKPIYMLQQFADIPASVPYPLAAMTAQFFPDQPRGYWTSSISFMLALAIAEGFTDIALYGIDLASDVEYQNQRAAAEYLIGVARGMGRTVTIAAGSALLKCDAVYGFDQQPGEADRPLSLPWLLRRKSALTAKRQKVVESQDKLLDMIHVFDGAIEETEFHIRLLQMAARGVQLFPGTES